MYDEIESEDYYERRTERADAEFDLFVEWSFIAVVIGALLLCL
jgi:hypothetical protein